MILGKRVVVVMPAYNAVKTLEQTVEQVDRDIVDDIVLVDDYSQAQKRERRGECDGVRKP